LLVAYVHPDAIVVGPVPEPDVGVIGTVECCHESVYNRVFSKDSSTCLDPEDVIASSRRRLCEMEILQQSMSIDFAVKRFGDKLHIARC
jgi:hypothetical protein